MQSPPWTIGKTAALIIGILALILLFLCFVLPGTAPHVGLWSLGLLAALAFSVVFL